MQNLFYLKENGLIFVVDKTGCYIDSFDPKTGENVHNLYRGRKEGKITSVSLLNKEFLAVSNSNKTIHIFSLDKSNIPFSIFKWFSKSYIYSTIKIRFSELVIEEEAEFLESSFKANGAILSSEIDGTELKVFLHNGFAYLLKIDFNLQSVEVKKRVNYLNKCSSILKEPFELEKDTGNNSIFGKSGNSESLGGLSALKEK